jgi:hypothetical protein
VGIKNVTPSAQLHLPAGVNSVGKAPLKFTAGTNLTTPEVGAMEFDGTNLFYSVTGPSRKTIATMDALTNFVGKTGDSMTGDLDIQTGSAIPFRVASTGGSVALNLRRTGPVDNLLKAQVVNGFSVMQTDIMNDGNPELTVQRTTPALGRIGVNNDQPMGVIHAVGDATTPTFIGEIYSASSSDAAIVQLNRSRGSIGSPSSVANTDNLGGLSISGFGSNFNVPSARILAVATENHGVSNHGANLIFETTANATGGPLPRMMIRHDGFVGIGTTTPTSSFEMRQTFDAPNILTVSTPGTGSSQQAGLLLETKSDGTTNIGTNANALGWMLWANGDAYAGPDGPAKTLNFMYWTGGMKQKAIVLDSGGDVMVGKHFGQANAAPPTAMGSCGTGGASVVGTDLRGTITTGTGTVSSCIMNFGSAFTSPPVCVISWEGSTPVATGISVQTSTNQMTIYFTTSSPSKGLNYICMM